MTEQTRTFCKMCGDEIGAGLPKNVSYFCDRHVGDADVWCGKCFGLVPCGRGDHSEGCSTMCCHGGAATTHTAALLSGAGS